MIGPSEEHPAADYFVFVAASDQGGGQHFAEPKAAHAWIITTGDYAVIDKDWTGGKAPNLDYHTRSVLIAAREAAERIPGPGSVHYFSDLSYFCDLLNADRAVRRQNGYRRSKGRGKLGKPLAYHEEWMALDSVLEAAGRRVSAGPPTSEQSRRLLESVKEPASLAARNIWRGYGEWERRDGSLV